MKKKFIILLILAIVGLGSCKPNITTDCINPQLTQADQIIIAHADSSIIRQAIVVDSKVIILEKVRNNNIVKPLLIVQHYDIGVMCIIIIISVITSIVLIGIIVIILDKE